MARRASRASASRIAKLAAAACLAKYRQVLWTERSCKLLRGGLLVELIDGHGLRAIDIARETDEKQSELSQMYRTARDFPPGSRSEGIVYNVLILGSWMARRFPELGLSPGAAVEEIRRVGLSQHRDVTRHFARASCLAERLQGRGPDLNTVETEGQMLQRVMPGLMGMKGVMVLNDEARHCYREKPALDGEEDEEPLSSDEREEAEKNRKAAHLWLSGLEAVNRKLGVNRVTDLSATPFFLRGSGYAEGTLLNPHLTMEQTARALNSVCRLWQHRRRKSPDLEHVASVIRYHQAHSEAAKRSRLRSVRRQT